MYSSSQSSSSMFSSSSAISTSSTDECTTERKEKWKRKEKKKRKFQEKRKRIILARVGEDSDDFHRISNIPGSFQALEDAVEKYCPHGYSKIKYMLETDGRNYPTIVESDNYSDFLDYVGEHTVTQLIVYPNTPSALELQRVPLQRAAAATAAVAVAASCNRTDQLLLQWRNTKYDKDHSQK